ncbi:MAG TPA: VWA domain-containing protein [Bryobacteraceae bacterium]|nr:VWA domain-containing protein [Bryobacteraceae bacterium]
MRDASTISRRSLLGALALLPTARVLRGQQQTPPAGTTYSATVKVVNLLATVRDKQGAIVKDLNQDDFVLDEDGRPQTISYFSRETDVPLTLGLLVDTSLSQRNVLAAERTASFRFLDKVMRQDKDEGFIIHFDAEVELLQDLTTSHDRLRKAVDELEVGRPQLSQRGPNGGGGGGYPGGGQRGGPRAGTTLYDAVFLGSDEIMRKQKGRKAFIVLSDGVDRGSKETLATAVESAQRADTLVYSILFADQDFYGSPGGFGGRGMGRHGGMGRGPMPETRDGKKVLEQISRETGGRFFEVSHKLPIDKVYEAIEEELRSQYSIGYTSDNKDTSLEYRHIHLSTKQKGLTVQTREGYYPGSA